MALVTRRDVELHQSMKSHCLQNSAQSEEQHCLRGTTSVLPTLPHTYKYINIRSKNYIMYNIIFYVSHITEQAKRTQCQVIYVHHFSSEFVTTGSVVKLNVQLYLVELWKQKIIFFSNLLLSCFTFLTIPLNHDDLKSPLHQKFTEVSKLLK